MLAIRLATAGREVTLLEKEREPHHKVCGEFLSPEAVDYLRRIGIEPLVLCAETIQHVRLHSGARMVEAHLPFTALSLSRRVLDETLLERATAAGCEVRRGAFVEKLQPSACGWTAKLRGQGPLQANTVFLATGKHDLNDWPRGSGSQSDLVGFKMHWTLSPAQTGALHDLMELFLFRGGYGGLSLVENGIANLCVVVRRSRLRELGGWTQLLNAIECDVPVIQARFHLGRPCWTKPLAISPIPYGHFTGPANGLWRIGDQAAVIPSFTGDGMSIALHTAELASEMYLKGGSPDDYVESLEKHLRPAMRFATALSLAMVTSAGRVIAPIALALRPSALGWIARKTRIPTSAIRVSEWKLGAQVSTSSPSVV